MLQCGWRAIPHPQNWQHDWLAAVRLVRDKQVVNGARSGDDAPTLPAPAAPPRTGPACWPNFRSERVVKQLITLESVRALDRSSPQRGLCRDGRGSACQGFDAWRRLGRQGHTELVKNDLHLLFRLGMTRQHEPAAIPQGNPDLDHLNGRQLFEHGCWS